MTTAPTSLWRHRDFRLLWAGETASQVGTRIGQVAAPLLAVTALGAGPWETGLLTAAQTSGFLLVGLVAGVVLDRVRRLPVMVAADLVRFALLATVPVAWVAGALTFGHLLLVTFAAGLATVFFDVAYQSVLPSLVGRAQLVDGNGKLESTRALSEAAGPAAGGGIAQLAGAASAVGAHAVGYLVSAVALLRIRTREPAPERAPTTVRAEIVEGLRFVLGHRLLRPIVLCTGTANLFGAALLAILVPFLVLDIGLPETAVGLLLASLGVGALAGAVTAPAWTRRVGQARTIVLALSVTAPLVLLVAAAGRGPLVAFAAVGLFAEGYGGVVYNVAQVSFRQSICPDRLLGRMNASVRFLVWGAMPLGALVGGAVAAEAGTRAAVAIAAAGMALAPLWVALSPLRRLRDLPAD